jgi:eukaryotic-like serine/threonine-protein kinase
MREELTPMEEPAPATEHVPHVRLDARTLTAEDWAHLGRCERCQRWYEMLARSSLSSGAGGRPNVHAPGDVLGDRYAVEAVLGRGGMGVVYLVRHLQLGSTHALKLLHLSDPRLRPRFLEEGRLQARLMHPNVVRVTDVVPVGEDIGLVMEFVDGPDLGQALAAGRSFTWEERHAVGRGIILGVHAAHCVGSIHRDLKPANVLLATHDGSWVPKVTDFGLARLPHGTDVPPTEPGVRFGTAGYSAPEQVDNPAGVDRRADVFSLGAILYELCTRQRAFAGSTRSPFVPPRKLTPDLPPAMEAAIVGALHADPARRFANCQELLDAWDGVDPGRRRAALGRWVAGGGALFLSGAAVIAAVSFAPVPSPAPAEVERATEPALVAAPAAPVLEQTEGTVASTAPPPPPTARRPASPPVAPGSFTLGAGGDVTEVWLQTADGSRLAPGAVPPGRYRVWAYFPRWGELASQVEVTVAPGETVSVRCHEAFTNCQLVR